MTLPFCLQLDETTIPLMPDPDLRVYLTRKGDRIAVKSYCERVSKKSTLLDRLRQKYADHVPSSKGQGNVNAMKATRAIELGWLNFDTSVGVYKQVRFRTGGGTRSLSVDKATPSTELLNLATSLFFPGGKSRLGRIEDFDCDLCDFKATVVNDSTVSEQYAEHKAKILRFYLRTKRKLCINMESSEEEIDLPIMSNPRKRKKYDYDRTVQKRRKPSATASDASSVHENRKSSSATRDVKESQNPSVTVPTIQESRNLSTAANGEQGSQNPSANCTRQSESISNCSHCTRQSESISNCYHCTRQSESISNCSHFKAVRIHQQLFPLYKAVRIHQQLFPQGSQNPSATVPTVSESISNCSHKAVRIHQQLFPLYKAVRIHQQLFPLYKAVRIHQQLFPLYKAVRIHQQLFPLYKKAGIRP